MSKTKKSSVGRDYVGRDKIIYGDEVHGDKVGGNKVTVGNITSDSPVNIAGGDIHVITQDFPSPPEPKQKASRASKPSATQKDKRMSASAKRLFNIVVGICTIIACISAVIVIPQIQQLLEPDRGNFSYQVRVQREGTGEKIKDAQVIIEVAGTVPLSGYTGSDGYAHIFVDASYAGQPGRLRVEATGYEPYWKEMDISKGLLADLIYLKRSQ